VTVAITAEQRDAVYDRMLLGLGGIADAWPAAGAAEVIEAERLGERDSDDLRRVLDDLASSGDPVELSAPPAVQRRVFSRLGEQAAARMPEPRNELVLAASRRVLAELDQDGSATGGRQFGRR
jgi:hypothetical protein